jgi:cytoskeleton protein RodZ
MTANESLAAAPVSDLAGIGRFLCVCRTEKKITVEEAAQELYLQRRQIIALEEGDFSGFNGPVFVKGYLRACARLYDVDGDRLVKLYDSLLPQQKTYNPVAAIYPEKVILVSRRSNKNFVFVSAFFVIAVFSCLLWLGYRSWPLVFPSLSGNVPQSVSDVPVQSGNVSEALTIMESMPAKTGSDSTSSIENAAAIPAESQSIMMPAESPVDAVLHVEFIDDCWVQLKADNGKVIHEKVHKKGEVFDMPVKTPLHVWFGRASAVNVSYNGAVVPVPVRPGFQSAQFVLGDEPSSGEIE